MPEETKRILTAPPASAAAAAAFGLPVGHMAYRVGPGASLLRSSIPPGPRGGLMVVDGAGFDGRGDVPSFCRQVTRECAARGFEGVILDFEGDPHPLLGQIAAKLPPLLAQHGWPVYVTQEYAGYSDRARVVIPSALSGGSLAKRLSEAAGRFGPDRVALGVQRSAEDFTLPVSGGGVPISREELDRRIAARGAAVYFSDDLCAHYFTYMSPSSGAHFVLFDNASSIRKKLHLAQSLGLCAAILAWPEVEDLIRDIL